MMAARSSHKQGTNAQSPHPQTPQDLNSRVIVVGDVHGCLDELQALLEKAQYDSNKDSVVLVGDLVNKGPKSAETVRYAREQGFYSVRGAFGGGVGL